MSMADENRAKVNELVTIVQEEIESLFLVIDTKIDEVIRESLVLGLEDSSDTNVRAVMHLAGQAKSELNLTLSTVAEMKFRLQDWSRRL